MKPKLLFILPTLPGTPATFSERRFFAMWDSLNELYEIHVLYSHFPVDGVNAVAELRARAITVFSVHEIAKKGVYAFDKQMALLMKEHSYQSIYFSSIYSAKYYIPFLALSPIDARIIIDGGKTRHVEEKLRASNIKSSYYSQAVAHKNFRITRLPEIAIYRHADVVVVFDSMVGDVLKDSLPNQEIRVVSEINSEKDLDRICFETREAFAAAAASPRMLKYPVSEPIMLNYEISNIIAAYNDALRRSTDRYATIVPPGTMIDTFTIERMIFCAESDKNIGIVSPVSSVVLAQAVSSRDIAQFRPQHFIANIGHWHESKHLEEPCFLVRREALAKVGYFDDRFQTLSYALYDFSLKLFQAGYSHVITHEAFVYYAQRHSDSDTLLHEDKSRFVKKWALDGAEFLEKMSHKL